MFEKFVEAYKFVDEHGTFTDNPWTRPGRIGQQPPDLFGHLVGVRVLADGDHVENR